MWSLPQLGGARGCQRMPEGARGGQRGPEDARGCQGPTRLWQTVVTVCMKPGVAALGIKKQRRVQRVQNLYSIKHRETKNNKY